MCSHHIQKSQIASLRAPSSTADEWRWNKTVGVWALARRRSARVPTLELILISAPRRIRRFVSCVRLRGWLFCLGAGVFVVEGSWFVVSLGCCVFGCCCCFVVLSFVVDSLAWAVWHMWWVFRLSAFSASYGMFHVFLCLLSGLFWVVRFLKAFFVVVWL